VIYDRPFVGQDLHRGCSHAVQGQERPRQDVEPAALEEGDCGTLEIRGNLECGSAQPSLFLSFANQDLIHTR
jgi:hypothetical protein